jgi:hypothetical protein
MYVPKTDETPPRKTVSNTVSLMGLEIFLISYSILPAPTDIYRGAKSDSD